MPDAYDKNGNATLRDVLDLQQKVFDKVEAINKEISNLKVKVAMISTGVATVVSILMKLVFR